MKIGSAFSGIGGFDLGLQRAGGDVRWQIENNKFCNTILERHWPEVKRYGDITTIATGKLERVDLICGGFPCQDLSVAGKRAGLAGERSGLFFEFMRIVGDIAPTWVLIENVPGLLSSNAGMDMGIVLGALGKLGYWWTYRVLDSQYFGVPQRRRRVYIVGHLGEPCPPEILFEPESVYGDTQAHRRAGQQVARPIRGRFDSGGDASRDNFVSHPLLAKSNSSFDASLETYVTYGPTNRPDGRDWHELEVARALNGDGRLGASSALIAGTVTGSESHNGNLKPIPDNYVVAQPIKEWTQSGGAMSALVSESMTVRRLTPRECERLQGFPDDWTLHDSDGPRYRALGNAVTVNVAEWIGRRLMEQIELSV